MKEQLITNQSSQIDQITAQRKNLEDMLATSKQQAQVLEEKFAASTQEIAKGNQIIQSLHTSAKQAKAKLKLKSTELAQKEKQTFDLERAEESSKHVVVEKERQISQAKDRETQLQKEIDELKKKLTEAHEALKSNQDVIEYLNRQLTERIPPVPNYLGIAG